MQKKTQLDSSSRFDTIPACDRQTRDDHTYRASLASRGKNAPTIARSRPIFTHAVSTRRNSQRHYSATRSLGCRKQPSAMVDKIHRVTEKNVHLFIFGSTDFNNSWYVKS